MLVWTLKANHPACRFYEKLGGTRVGEQTFESNGVTIPEVAYAWQNIQAADRLI